MATPTGVKSRGKTVKEALEEWVEKAQNDLKNKPKEEKNLLQNTCNDFRKLLDKNMPDVEMIKHGQTIFGKVKKTGKEFSTVKELEKTLIVLETTEKKKEDDEKGLVSKTRTTDNSQEENQSVNAGAAPVPIPSTQSPKPKHKSTVDVSKPSIIRDTEHLLSEIAKLKMNLDEERKEHERVKQLCYKRENELKELDTDVKTKDENIERLERESDHLAKSLQKEKLDHTNVKRELDLKQSMNLGLEKRLNEYSSTEVAYKKQLQEMTSYIDKLEKDKSALEKSRQRDLEHFQDEKKQQARKFDELYKKLTEERDDLRDRFSKLAGAKLQEKNADIADLSDPNRAMKLSEKFGQIYDDEWTNAFEVLTDKKAGFQLKDAIDFLLRLLQECWSYCNKLMETQMESVHSVFLLPAQNVAKFDQKKMGKKNPPRISSKDNQTLYDLRRKIGVFPAVVEEVKEALLSESKRWDKQKIGYDTKYVDACAPYIQKCAEICWLMALHDPPLYMKMEVKPGEKLDQNIYSVYSSSGNSIDFLVWPPLYNGKEGGLLAKGVVEPQRTIGKKK